MSNKHLVSLQTILEKNALASATPSAISRTLTGKRPTIDHDSKVLINMIFARFHHIYTHRFESAYGDETTLNMAKREWAMTLVGTTTEQIEFALERCKREYAWPPTIAEFLKLLEPNPEDLGLPSIEFAYQEACLHAHDPLAHHWSHACVQLAARETGYFRLRNDAERATKPIFKATYERLCKRLLAGEEFSLELAPALPEPDFHEESSLVSQLLALKVDEKIAQSLAYYLSKPVGSDVRKRYRKRSESEIEKRGIVYTLPE